MFYGRQTHQDQCENPLQVLLQGGAMKGKGNAQLPQISFLILACACLWCLPVDEASRVHVLCINWLTAPMIACLFPQEIMFKIIDCLVQYFTVKYSLVLILDPPLPPISCGGGCKFFLAKCLSRFLTKSLKAAASMAQLPSPSPKRLDCPALHIPSPICFVDKEKTLTQFRALFYAAETSRCLLFWF